MSGIAAYSPRLRVLALKASLTRPLVRGGSGKHVPSFGSLERKVQYFRSHHGNTHSDGEGMLGPTRVAWSLHMAGSTLKRLNCGICSRDLNMYVSQMNSMTFAKNTSETPWRAARWHLQHLRSWKARPLSFAEISRPSTLTWSWRSMGNENPCITVAATRLEPSEGTFKIGPIPVISW